MCIGTRIALSPAVSYISTAIEMMDVEVILDRGDTLHDTLAEGAIGDGVVEVIHRLPTD